MDKWTYDGDWEAAKRKLRSRYATLTDDDLQYQPGREEEFFSRLHRRIGGEPQELRRGVIQLLGTNS